MSAAVARLAALVAAWLDGEHPPGRLEVDDPGKSLTRDDPGKSLTRDDDLVALANAHRIEPILFDLARRVGDAAVVERLRPAFYRTWARNRVLLEVAAEVTAALYDAGVPVVRLKGIDLVGWAYREPGLRPMDDIDVLVPRERVGDAVERLLGLGLQLPAGGLGVEHYLEHHFHLALVEPRRRVYVEVHWELLDRFRRGGLEGAALWSSTRPVDAARPELGRRLAPELLWLHLALHLDKHGPFHDVLCRHRGAAAALGSDASEGRLLWLADLALVTRAQPIDGEHLHRLATDAGVERGLATSVDLLAELLGERRVPRGLRERFAPVDDGWLVRGTERAVARLLASERPTARRLLGWAGRMDPALQVRPIRLLELPLSLLRRGGERGARRADLARAARMMSSALRRRGAGRPVSEDR